MLCLDLRQGKSPFLKSKILGKGAYAGGRLARFGPVRFSPVQSGSVQSGSAQFG
jgi:hypothetical protein